MEEVGRGAGEVMMELVDKKGETRRGRRGERRRTRKRRRRQLSFATQGAGEALRRFTTLD